MEESTLCKEAHAIVSALDESEAARDALMPRWGVFENFLKTLGPLPDNIPAIPASALAEYAGFVDHQDIHVDDALLLLGAVRLICLQAGCDVKKLGAMVIPRIKRQVKGRRYESFREREYYPLRGKTAAS
jgi:hypothetical protein